METLNFSVRLAGLAIAASLMGASATFADWVEVGDAPEGVPAHQDTVGVGPLLFISGSLDSFDYAVDHVDTYAIIITDPDNFWASTTPALGGFATGGSTDTRLWLWTVGGLPLLGNEDSGGTYQSTISSTGIFASLAGGAVDSSASAITLAAGQTYLLSISYYPNAPVDSLGNDLFNLDYDYAGLLGPIPTAGPMAGWKNAWQEGFTYQIALNGATSAIPEPATMALLGAGAIGLLRRRHFATKTPSTMEPTDEPSDH